MKEIDYRNLGIAYRKLTMIDNCEHSAKRAARKPFYALYEIMTHIRECGLGANGNYIDELESLSCVDIKNLLDYKARYDEREEFLEGFYEE